MPDLVLSCGDLRDLETWDCDAIVQSVLSRDYFERPRITSSNVLSYFPIFNANLNLKIDFLLVLYIKFVYRASGITLTFCTASCLGEHLGYDELINNEYSNVYNVQRYRTVLEFHEKFLNLKCSACQKFLSRCWTPRTFSLHGDHVEHRVPPEQNYYDLDLLTSIHHY